MIARVASRYHDTKCVLTNLTMNNKPKGAYLVIWFILCATFGSWCVFIFEIATGVYVHPSRPPATATSTMNIVAPSSTLTMGSHPTALDTLDVYSASNTLELSVATSGIVYINKDCVSSIPVTKQECENAISKAFAPYFPKLPSSSVTMGDVNNN